MSQNLLYEQRRAEPLLFGFSEIFAQQFHARREPTEQMSGFHHNQIAGWHVYSGKRLSATPLVDKNDKAVALVLGIAVGSDDRLVHLDSFRDLDGSAPDFNTAAQARVEGMAGRFVCFLKLSDGSARLYTDPASTCPVTYDPETGLITSTTSLCLERDLQENPLFPKARLFAGELVTSMGHTLDRSVQYLYTNHFLDLTDFTRVRHWPKPDASPNISDLSVDAVAATISRRMNAITKAITDTYPVVLPITGGHDSRLLVSMCAKSLDRFQYGYCHTTNYMTGIDAEIGAQIAKATGIRFAVHSTEHPRFPQVSRFEARQIVRAETLACGDLGRPRDSVFKGYDAMLPRNALVFRGGLVDLLRAVWWRSWPRRRELNNVNVEDEVVNLNYGRLAFADVPASLVLSYEEWRDGLPVNIENSIHDRMFLELIYPWNWQKYSGLTNGILICPFADRNLLELTMSLPVQERFGMKWHKAIVEALAPSLDGIPSHYAFRNERRQASLSV
jgi:hypothetical protein